MTITPIHPNLLLERRMTAEEMLDALKYEGLFSIGWRDLPVAIELKIKGIVTLDFYPHNSPTFRGWIICLK